MRRMCILIDCEINRQAKVKLIIERAIASEFGLRAAFHFRSSRRADLDFDIFNVCRPSVPILAFFMHGFFL